MHHNHGLNASRVRPRPDLLGSHRCETSLPRPWVFLRVSGCAGTRPGVIAYGQAGNANVKCNINEVLTLLAEHGERLHALLTRLTLRTEIAEDLMQDLFCKLAENDRFHAASNRAAYATRMAMNLAFDHRRRQRRALLDDVDPNALAGAPSKPLLDLVRREELDALLDAVGNLPDGYREVVVLRYLEQQDFETIGQQLDKTAHHARALCCKAIAKLRRVLDVEQDDVADIRRPGT